MHIPRREIGQRAAAGVFMLDPHRLARAGGCTGVRAYPRLDRGLLIGAEDELAPAQGVAFPLPRVQV